MKNLLFVFALMLLVGCAAPSYSWKTQPDKTDIDRDRDYEFCIKEAGTVYGFLATMTWYGILNNTKSKYQIEENCLREKGWIE